MAIRNQNWYNANSTRSYPLDENSTGLSDTGAFINNAIVVDCHIRFPESLGSYAYIQGIAVSAGLVTVVIGVGNELDMPGGPPVAAVTVTRPNERYVHHAITALVPGVYGWIVFGPGTDELFSGRYSKPRQSLLMPRCARPYKNLPIPSIGKVGVAGQLSGVINLQGTTPVAVTYESVAIDPEEPMKKVPAVVFRLDAQEITTAYNPLSEFLGPCGVRPESGTCAKTPIESINGIEPDCNGNINIEFGEPLRPFEFFGCGGIAIGTDNGLSEMCDILKPKKPQEYNDKCCELIASDGRIIPQGSILAYGSILEFPVTGDAEKFYLDFATNLIYEWSLVAESYLPVIEEPIDPFCWPKIENIDPDGGTDEELNIINYPCKTLPRCFDFSSCALSSEFNVEVGGVDVVQAYAPPICPDCSDNQPVPGLTNHNVLGVTNTSSLTLYTIKNCRTGWWYSKTFTVEMQLLDGGIEKSAGIVLNYRQVRENGRVVTKYVALFADFIANVVRVIAYNGTTTVELGSYRFAAGGDPEDWHVLSVTPTLVGGGMVALIWSLSNKISGVTNVGMDVYGSDFGLYGLFSRRTNTNFNKLTVA
jgi:hypothetical protein